MNKHGGDLYRNKVDYDFSTNINPLGMPERVKQAAYRGIELSSRYPDCECEELRQKIASMHCLKKETIICGNGAAELIYDFVRVIQPKSACILAPTFSEYEMALKSVNCNIDYYNLKEEQEYKLTVEFLTQLDQSYDLVFLCNPNNPTGQVISSKLLDEIIKKCEEKKCYLFLDECFQEFLEKEDSRIKQIENTSYLIILKAFTKIFAMAGLRLGYAICSDYSLIRKVIQTKQPWSVSLPAQMAGIAALDEKEFIQQTKEYIGRERRYLLSTFEEMEIQTFGSMANYIFFKEQNLLEEYYLRKRILIRSCENYHGLTEGYYRIAVRTHKENKIFLKYLKERKNCSCPIFSTIY